MFIFEMIPIGTKFVGQIKMVKWDKLCGTEGILFFPSQKLNSNERNKY